MIRGYLDSKANYSYVATIGRLCGGNVRMRRSVISKTSFRRVGVNVRETDSNVESNRI